MYEYVKEKHDNSHFVFPFYKKIYLKFSTLLINPMSVYSILGKNSAKREKYNVASHNTKVLKNIKMSG